MTEEEYKKIMLDFSDVNPKCPESVRRYGERCTLAGEIYYGMIRAEKEVKRLKEKMKFIGTDPERYYVSVPKSLEKALVTRAAQEMVTVEELLTELIQHKINWPIEWIEEKKK